MDAVMQQVAIDAAREALYVTTILSLPMLGCALIIGLIISLLQALTQVNEMTLTFVPKVLGLAGALVLLMPWMMAKMIGFTQSIFHSIGSF